MNKEKIVDSLPFLIFFLGVILGFVGTYLLI